MRGGCIRAGHLTLMCCSDQLRVAAFDTGNPDQKVYTDMKIYVSRNENGPEFKKDSYSTTIVKSTALGSPILTVQAVDKDTVTQSKTERRTRAGGGAGGRAGGRVGGRLDERTGGWADGRAVRWADRETDCDKPTDQQAVVPTG